jgi:hypothetical protein
MMSTLHQVFDGINANLEVLYIVQICCAYLKVCNCISFYIFFFHIGNALNIVKQSRAYTIYLSGKTPNVLKEL